MEGLLAARERLLLFAVPRLCFRKREALGAINQYSTAREGGLISLAIVRMLARLIGHLDAQSRSFTVVPGHAGVFHILFDTPTTLTPNSGASTVREV